MNAVLDCKPLLGVSYPLFLDQIWKIWNHTVCQPKPECQSPITVAMVTLPSNRTVASALGSYIHCLSKAFCHYWNLRTSFFIGSNHSLFTAWRGASRVVGMVTAEVDCHARAHVCVYVKVSWKLLSTFSSQFHPSSHELLKKEQEQEALLKRLARNGLICYEIVSFLYVWNQWEHLACVIAAKRIFFSSSASSSSFSSFSDGTCMQIKVRSVWHYLID